MMVVVVVVTHCSMKTFAKGERERERKKERERERVVSNQCVDSPWLRVGDCRLVSVTNIDRVTRFLSLGSFLTLS